MRLPRRRRPTTPDPPPQPATALSRAVGGLFDAALLGVLAGGLAARHVHPDVVWWPQLAAMVLPAAGLAALARAAALGRRGRRGGGRAAWLGVGLYAGVALAVAARYGPPMPRADAADGDLTLVSLNAGRPGPQAVPTSVAELADRPDLVVLQEGTFSRRELPDGTAVFGVPIALAAVGAGYRAQIGQGDEDAPAASPAATGLHVFSRGRSASVAPIALDPNADDLSGRAARAELEWQGRRIAVYNIHLRSFGPERPWSSDAPWTAASLRAALANFRDTVVRRAREAERLRALLDAEPLPYVVVGDFNSTPQQWVYAHLADGHAESLARTGWRRGTYPSRFPLVAIDHALGGPGWEVVRARIGADGISDHRPVHAAFRWHAPGVESAE